MGTDISAVIPSAPMRHLAIALAVLATAACSTGSSVVGGPTDSAVTDLAAVDNATIDVPLDALGVVLIVTMYLVLRRRRRAGTAAG